MSNIQKFDSLDDALAAETEAAAPKARGKKSWEVTVEQSKLPKGVTRFRVLPREGSPLPWVGFSEHEIFNRTQEPTARKMVRFNCPAGGSDNGLCKACSRFLPMLERARKGGVAMPGAEDMAKNGRAAMRHAVNVVFEQWGGGAVPSDLQGVKIFKYKQGVHKGGDKTEVRGLLRLLQDHREALTSTEDGITVEIEKTGEGMDTKYAVRAWEAMQEVTIGGKKQKIKTAVLSPLANAEAVLADRHNLEALARHATPDEIDLAIEDISPIPTTVVGEAASRQLPRGSASTDRFRANTDHLKGSTLQDSIDVDGPSSGPADDSDIPFDMGH